MRILAVVAIASALTPIAARVARADPSPRFGVRWRVALSGSQELVGGMGTALPAVAHGVVAVADPKRITTYDLATGAKRRSVAMEVIHIVAAGDELVARSEKEEVGLDPDTLRVRWRSAAPDSLKSAGGVLFEIAGAPHVLTARRARDGVALWTHPMAEGMYRVMVDGGAAYVQHDGSGVVALDLASGAERWHRAGGFLLAASGGRVAVETADHEFSVLGADGTTQRELKAQQVRLDGELAFVVDVDGKTLTAIDLASGAARWHHDEPLDVVGADATWIYGARGTMDEDPWLVALDRATGAEVWRAAFAMPGTGDTLTSTGGPTRIAMATEGWVFGLGERAADEPRREVTVRGRAQVTGCPGSGPGWLAGATVTIAGASAKTDAHGRFHLRARVTRAPEPITIAKPDLHLDLPFVTTVVIDPARPLALWAQDLGAGCDGP